MKTVRITDIMADFLDSIREYEHKSGRAICFDERESSEFVDMYFNGGGKIKIEEKKPLFITDVFCHKCGNVMKFTGKALLSNPQQYEYRCEKCESIRYILDNQYK